MPYLETPNELAEDMADKLGIYGAHAEDELRECRVCFVPRMAERIRIAAKNEIFLAESERKGE